VEPDARFTFANERTFLAWIRTSLALIAAGVAVDSVTLAIPSTVQHVLAASMIALGVVTAATSWLRWARAERAMRRGEPLPASPVGAAMAIGVVLAGVILLAVAV
jgi:putative membrane protein